MKSQSNCEMSSFAILSNAVLILKLLHRIFFKKISNNLVILIMFFLRFRIVFENILIVIFFLWYSKLSRNFYNMKSCKMFLSLIKLYRTNFFFANLCVRRNLFFIRLWNSIANSLIAKWFSELINENNSNLKTFQAISIFQNYDALLYDICWLNSTFKWRSMIWYRSRLNNKLWIFFWNQNDWIVLLKDLWVTSKFESFFKKNFVENS